jgi:hypothetical protein
MDKKKPVYAHGELEKVRQRLGDIEPQEAVRIAKLLGGEVGAEQEETPAAPARPSKPSNTKSASDFTDHPEPRETTANEKETRPAAQAAEELKSSLEDDPSEPIKLHYFDRIRIDRYMAYPEFDIKSPTQVFLSIVSFVGSPPDYVNPLFVQKRVNEYYKTLEQLVVSTRRLFPQKNQYVDERLKKISPLAFSILDTIRTWDIEAIAMDITRIQAHPRHVVVNDFATILQVVYKPLFILEALDIDNHIKTTFLLLYKLLLEQEELNGTMLQDPQVLMGTAISAYNTVHNDIHYLLYPFLLKLLSNKFISYELFFTNRRKRYMAFLNVKEEDILAPEIIPTGLTQEIEEQSSEEQAAEGSVSAKQLEQERIELEQKAVQQGLQIMDTFFPKAGWKTIDQFPDIYPYFSNIFDLKHGYEFIAPDDPLLHVVVLMNMLGNMFQGMHFVKFSTAAYQALETELNTIISNWGTYLDTALGKEYLPRLNEYYSVAENAANARDAVYTKRLHNELQWIRRLFFFPHYTFDVKFASPLKKEEIISIYSEIRKLRRTLTTIASGIDIVNRQSSSALVNIWNSYNFQIANPISVRLNALLSDKKRTNALLIFFTLSITMTLDHLVNNENSWAYSNHPQSFLRSSSNPIGNKIDTDLLFKQSLKENESSFKAKTVK